MKLLTGTRIKLFEGLEISLVRDALELKERAGAFNARKACISVAERERYGNLARYKGNPGEVKFASSARRTEATMRLEAFAQVAVRAMLHSTSSFL